MTTGLPRQQSGQFDPKPPVSGVSFQPPGSYTPPLPRGYTPPLPASYEPQLPRPVVGNLIPRLPFTQLPRPGQALNSSSSIRSQWDDIRPKVPSSRVIGSYSSEHVGATIIVPPEFDQMVEKISYQTGLDKGEILRRAILLMDAAVEARVNGDKVAILDKNGNPKTEITGFNI